jgi:hypothetical protein
MPQQTAAAHTHTHTCPWAGCNATPPALGVWHTRCAAHPSPPPPHTQPAMLVDAGARVPRVARARARCACRLTRRDVVAVWSKVDSQHLAHMPLQHERRAPRAAVPHAACAAAAAAARAGSTRRQPARGGTAPGAQAALLGARPAARHTRGSAAPRHASTPPRPTRPRTVRVEAHRPGQRAVGVERHGVHRPAVPLLLLQARPRLHIPQPPRHVVAGRRLRSGAARCSGAESASREAWAASRGPRASAEAGLAAAQQRGKHRLGLGGAPPTRLLLPYTHTHTHTRHTHETHTQYTHETHTHAHATALTKWWPMGWNATRPSRSVWPSSLRSSLPAPLHSAAVPSALPVPSATVPPPPLLPLPLPAAPSACCSACCLACATGCAKGCHARPVNRSADALQGGAARWLGRDSEAGRPGRALCVRWSRVRCRLPHAHRHTMWRNRPRPALEARTRTHAAVLPRRAACRT